MKPRRMWLRPMLAAVLAAAVACMTPGAAMAQQAVMMRALRGEAVTAIDIVLPGGMAIAITALALAAQARLLRNERIIFSR